MPDPDQNNWKGPLAFSAAIVAVFVGGGYLASNLVAPPPVPAITLAWDLNEPDPGVITEVWSSTDLKTWAPRTNVHNTNRVTLPRNKPAEFFIVRNRLGTNVSEWSRK